MDIFCCLLYWNKLDPYFHSPLLSKTLFSKGMLSRFCQKSKRRECIHKSSEMSPLVLTRGWENQTYNMESGILHERFLKFEIMSFTSWKNILTFRVWNGSLNYSCCRLSYGNCTKKTVRDWKLEEWLCLVIGIFTTQIGTWIPISLQYYCSKE